MRILSVSAHHPYLIIGSVPWNVTYLTFAYIYKNNSIYLQVHNTSRKHKLGKSHCSDRYTYKEDFLLRAYMHIKIYFVPWLSDLCQADYNKVQSTVCFFC
jgi:hypothetical protein